MGFFSSISQAVFREYDRRIKRASLITEYGAHHGHGHDDHADTAHDDHADADTEQAEIMNVPRGTPVEQPKH
ncbi:MAG: hypothetical protein U0Z44_22720 [Kouleothrix sp.]|jgi:hypothetical protein|nr:hypothetical protein [Kouleothrix sp.]